MSISSFKEFIKEEEQLVIDIKADESPFMTSLDKLNADLDAVTDRPFTNSAVFMNAVRGTLERYGVLLPPNYVIPALAAEAETTYTLGDSGLYLYICHDMNDGAIEGYAQIVNEDELNALTDMGVEDSEDDQDEEDVLRKPWIPPARRDDDSGNDSEYA